MFVDEMFQHSQSDWRTQIAVESEEVVPASQSIAQIDA